MGGDGALCGGESPGGKKKSEESNCENEQKGRDSKIVMFSKGGKKANDLLREKFGGCQIGAGKIATSKQKNSKWGEKSDLGSRQSSSCAKLKSDIGKSGRSQKTKGGKEE